MTKHMQQIIRINGIHVDLHVPSSTGIQWVYMFLADIFFSGKSLGIPGLVMFCLQEGLKDFGDSSLMCVFCWEILELIVQLDHIRGTLLHGKINPKDWQVLSLGDVELFQVIMANPDIHLAVVIILDWIRCFFFPPASHPVVWWIHPYNSRSLSRESSVIQKGLTIVSLGIHVTVCMVYPIVSMYGIFRYIYHKNQPNVGKYTIHRSYGYLPTCTIKTTGSKLLTWSGFRYRRWTHTIGRNLAQLAIWMGHADAWFGNEQNSLESWFTHAQTLNVL